MVNLTELPPDAPQLCQQVLAPGMYRHALTMEHVCELWRVRESMVLNWVRKHGAPCYTVDPKVSRRAAKSALLRFNYDELLNWLEGANAY